MWMRNDRFRNVIGRSRLMRSVTVGLQSRLQLTLLAGHKNPATISLLRRCRAGGDSLLSGDEAFLLHSLARAQSRMEGAFAEFGVYQGSSARLLCESKGPRALHLFDTFEGLPEGCPADRGVFTRGQFRGSLAQVQARLRGFPDVHYHCGVFPLTAGPARHLRFSLVHLDVDLNTATRAGLEFFYERMVPGGIIISHDYSVIPGVARAFDDFMADKPERLIDLPTTQAMVIRQAA